MTRIATVTTYQKSTNYLQKLNSRLDRASDQYNTGLKYRTASDAPADYSATMRMEKEISMYEQYTINSGYAIDSLNLEETSLDAINERLDRAQVLITSSINASYSETELGAVAAELEEIRDYVLGLMNTKTTEGEYIFSGSRGTTEAFTKDNSGNYVYNGDNGQRKINASSSVSIAVSDSGLSIFENVDAPRGLRAVTPAGSPEVHATYDNYDTFSSFYESFFNPDTGVRNAPVNDASFSFALNATGDAYDVSDPDGNIIAAVKPSEDGVLTFKGMSIITNGAGNFSVELEKPSTDNVLNTLSRAIAALKSSRDPSSSDYMPLSEVNYILTGTEMSITSTQNSINNALGKIGARQNTLDTVINSNQAITDVKKEAKATISEADLYETTSELAQVQSILQMSMKSFNYVTGTSLFDYIS